LLNRIDKNQKFLESLKKAISEDKILNLQTPVHNYKNTFLQYSIANDVSDKALQILEALDKHQAIKPGFYGDEMQDCNQRTALHLAITKKYDNPADQKHFKYHVYDKKLINFLIEKSSAKTLLTKDELGNTVLHYAILKGDHEIVEKIISKAKELEIYDQLKDIKNNNQQIPQDLFTIDFQQARDVINSIYTGYEMVENPQALVTKKTCFSKKTYKKFNRIIHSTLKTEDEWNQSQQLIGKIFEEKPRTSSPILPLASLVDRTSRTI